MKQKNITDLERLSLFCHFTGLFSVFIGLTVTFIDVLNNDMSHVQVGIYVFITGYAFTKISKKLTSILYDENT